MISVANIQSEVYGVLANATYFENIAVLSDDGIAERKIEESLRDNGAAVVVLPIVSGTPLDQFPRGCMILARIPVRAVINPEVNSENNGANLTWHGMLGTIHNEVLHIATDADCAYKAATPHFERVLMDRGVLAYDITFEKPALLDNQ